MADESKQILNACPTCNTVLDVSQCEPYSKVTCQQCATTIRVRRQFNHFEIQAEIGRGGMSRVFRAQDPTLDRQVALKILLRKFSEDSERMEQLETEARITASLSHPNVVKLYSVGQDQGYFYLAMELVESPNLDELIQKQGAYTEAQALALANQVAQGLHAAYRNGLIHRDIKPGNILVADRNAKIVDFGLALAYEHARQESGEIWATPYYVAPEKLYGEPEDFRSDIYSLGATMYHMLTGHAPCEDANTTTMERLRAAKDAPLDLSKAAPHLTKEVCQLVNRMVARDPAKRHASYDELLQDFERAAAAVQQSSAAFAKTASPDAYMRLRKQHQRSRQLMGGLVALVITLGACGGLIYYGIQQRKKNEAEASDDRKLTGVSDGDVLGGVTTSKIFLEGRSSLLSGDFAGAADNFAKLHENDSVPQPTRSWAAFNHGLALLLDDKEKQSREVFAELGMQTGYDDIDRENELREFFARVSDRLQDDQPVLMEFADNASDGTADRIGMMAYGLKNWNLGQFTTAGHFFKRFQELNSHSNDEWIRQYAPLIEDYEADAEALAEVREVDEADGLGKLRAKFAKVTEAQGNVISGGAAERHLKRLTKAYRARIEIVEKRENERMATAMAAKQVEELKTLAAKARELKPLGPQLKFTEALAALEEFEMESPGGKQALEDQRYLWQSGDAFITHLLQDLAAGFEGEIPRGDRPSLRGKVVSANRKQLTLQLDRGSKTTVPFSDLSTQNLAMLGEAVIQSITRLEGILWSPRGTRHLQSSGGRQCHHQGVRAAADQRVAPVSQAVATHPANLRPLSGLTNS